MRPLFFMVITPHMLVGAAVGAHSPNLWSAFILGLFSHFLLDALPHWDYLKKVKISNPDHLKKIGLDFILGGLLVLFLTWSSPQKLFILVALGAALLLDCLEAIYYNFNIKWLRPLSLIHHKIHFQKRLCFWSGLPLMLIVSLLALLILIFDKWG